MSSPIRKLLYPLTLPCGLIVLVAAVAIRHTDPAWLTQPLLTQLPLLVALFGVLLAWRLGRSRVVLALVAVFANYLLLRHFGLTGPGRFAFAASALLLPVNLLLIRLLPERGLFTTGSLGKLVLLFSQAAAGVWLYHRYGPAAQAWLERDWFGPVVPGLAHLPPLGLVSFAVTGLVLFVRYTLHPSALDSAFLWTLAALLPPHMQQIPPIIPGYFTTAMVVLIAGLVEAVHVLAFRDELTGLPARRALNDALAGAGRRYTLAMVDVDHFKRVNDRHGHDVGDQVLKRLASRLARVSGGGRAYRYGGEEFTLFFPRKRLEEVLPHLEQLRRSIAAEPFKLRRFLRPRNKPQAPRTRRKPPKSMQVTVSIGAAERGDQLSTATQVVKAADQALYRAKRNGRDQVRH